MFDHMRLKEVLVQYKQNFVSKQWGNEKYKWEAVKWFQDNWDVNAPDFPEMLNRSLDKTFNLLASANNFPRGMIINFAKAAPEEVRAMFIALFDESKDVFERMDAFKLQSTILLEKYGNGAAQHYQYENIVIIAITDKIVEGSILIVQDRNTGKRSRDRRGDVKKLLDSRYDLHSVGLFHGALIEQSEDREWIDVYDLIITLQRRHIDSGIQEDLLHLHNQLLPVGFVNQQLP